MLLTLMMLLAAGQGAADPLAPARAGKMQCVAPNKEKKTCLAIGSFTVRPDGSYDSVVTVMINPVPAITMETRSTGKVENGAVCGTVRKEDYAAAKLTLDGAPMDEAMAAGVRTQVAAAVASMDGKYGCSHDKPDGDMFVAEVTLDGVARPELTQKFIWIGADDGYKLGMP
jgi:hypothetical protein